MDLLEKISSGDFQSKISIKNHVQSFPSFLSINPYDKKRNENIMIDDEKILHVIKIEEKVKIFLRQYECMQTLFGNKGNRYILKSGENSRVEKFKSEGLFAKKYFIKEKKEQEFLNNFKIFRNLYQEIVEIYHQLNKSKTQKEKVKIMREKFIKYYHIFSQFLGDPNIKILDKNFQFLSKIEFTELIIKSYEIIKSKVENIYYAENYKVLNNCKN